MFFDSAAVFGEDAEFDGGGFLGAFFQDGDFGFKRGFIHVKEFVFRIAGQFRGFLLFAKVAK